MDTELESKQVEMARSFASIWHGKQRYGNHPYIYHLKAVAKIVKPYGYLAQIVAYLHDVKEDTEVTKEDIVTEFGSWTYNCVELLTDPSGKNRKERKDKLHNKLGQIYIGNDISYGVVLIVKAADRLANLKEGGKNDMYKKEHEAFKKAVYRPGLCDDIWKEIEEIIND